MKFIPIQRIGAVFLPFFFAGILAQGVTITATDGFASAPVVTNAQVTVRGDTASASAEAGEPSHAGMPAKSSVWFKFQTTGVSLFRLAVGTLPSDGLRVAIYRGDALTNLVPVTATSIVSKSTPMDIMLDANVLYSIAVDAVSSGGSFMLYATPYTFVLTAPAHNTHFSIPAVVQLNAADLVTNFQAQYVRFYGNQQLLGTLYSPPWTLTVTNATGGSCQYYATAYGGAANSRNSQYVTVNCGPTNDDFANALIIASNTASWNITAAANWATVETGEPSHSGVAPYRTIWWRWTPCYDGLVQVTETNSYAYISAYSGDQLTNLIQVAGLTPTNNKATFSAVAGTTYSISVDGSAQWQGCQETLRLQLPAEPLTVGRAAMVKVTNLLPSHPLQQLQLYSGSQLMGSITQAPWEFELTPSQAQTLNLSVQGVDDQGNVRQSLVQPVSVLLANDNFEQAATLDGQALAQSFFASNALATAQSNEPAHAGVPAKRSLWWQWTPAQPGIAEWRVTTAGSGQIRMAVYTGDALTNLMIVTNLAAESRGVTNTLIFAVQPSQRYLLMIDGVFSDVDGVVASVLECHTLAFTQPETRRLVLDRACAIAVQNLDSTFAPAGMDLYLDGAAFAHIDAAPWTYSMDSAPGGWHVLTASATNLLGETRTTAPFLFHVGPANDDLNQAELITPSAPPFLVSGDTAFSTWEPGETPFTAAAASGSVWYRWTPSIGRPYSIRFTGSPDQVLYCYADGFSDFDSTLYRFPQGGVVAAVNFQTNVTYLFRVECFRNGDSSAPFTIEMFAPPANDNFADAIELSGESGPLIGTNASASVEPGEPAASYFNGTLWWKWTAPATGDLILSGSSECLDAVAGVFTGSSVDQLTPVLPPVSIIPVAKVRVRAGVTYHLMVAGSTLVSSGIIQGWFSLGTAINPPPNDFFEDRISLTGLTNTVYSTTRDATTQYGEYDNGDRTLWWQYTVAVDGVLKLWADGASTTPVLMLYSGTNFNELQVAYPRGDQTSSGFPDYERPVKAGEVYQICVGDGSWASGPQAITLHVINQALPPAPVNDNFTNAITISSATYQQTVSVLNTSFEPGEPNHMTNFPYMGSFCGSVWWRIVPTHSIRLIVQPSNATVYPALALYEGATLEGLRAVTNNFNINSTIVQELTAGKTYYLAAVGQTVNPSTFDLSVKLEDLVPGNDNFSGSILLAGTNVTISGPLIGCTRESGEPVHTSYTWDNPNGQSAWWSWVAPVDARVVVDYEVDNEVISVYTGSAVTNLQRTTSVLNNQRLIFAATAGTTYYFGVEGRIGGSGLAKLTLNASRFATNCPTDNFHDAREIVGAGSTVESNVGATREPGEPAHRAGGPNKSIWWKWVVPNNGIARINNSIGSLRNVTFAVYSGAAIDCLTMVAGGTDSVSFLANGGQLYYIAAETPADWNGDIEVWATPGGPDGRLVPVPGNLVQNPSFENIFDLWQIGDNVGAMVGSRPGEGGADGRAFLVCYPGGAVSQTLATVPGRAYRVKMAVAAGLASTPTVKITFGAQALPDTIVNGSDMGGTWYWIDYVVTATSDSTVLSIACTDQTFSLDDVSVAPAYNPPQIVLQPVSCAVFPGTPVTFSVKLTGTEPMRKQWFHDGQPMAGQTGPTLILTNATGLNAGTYQLQATNEVGWVVSDSVTLTIEEPEVPLVVLQPASRSAALGEYVCLSVAVVGAAPMSYQWYENGTPLADQTNIHLVFSAFAPTNAGSYSVVVSNSLGSAASLPAVVTLEPGTPQGGAMVYFNNQRSGWFVTAAPIYDADGVAPLDGAGFCAQLYVGLTQDKLFAVGTPRAFLTGTKAGYFTPGWVTLSNIPPATPVYVQVRAWDRTQGESYEEVESIGGKVGKSNIVPTTTSGGAPPPLIFVEGIQSFNLSTGFPAYRRGRFEFLDRYGQSGMIWRLIGQPGARYLIERQSDGFNWTPFMTLVNTNGQAKFMDFATNTVILYRGRVLP